MIDKVFTVLVDMDDVLVGLLPAWLDVLNRQHHLDVKESDIKDWNMRLAFPTLTDKQLYGVLNTPYLWMEVKPIEGAVETLKEMYEHPNLNVKIVTATHYKNLATKLCYALFPYFDFLNYKDIIMCHDKSLIDRDFIIDDYEENLKGEGIRFLVNAPYNVNASALKYDYRVDNLAGAFRTIKHYLELAEEHFNDAQDKS